MEKVQVAVVNESTCCTDDEINQYVTALQQQVSQDFAPVWGTDATLTFVAKGEKPSPAAWLMAVLDNSDQAGALGYHDLTAQGNPLGKVFAATDKQYNSKVSVTISHELLEMLGDPGINMTASSQDSHGRPVFYAYEACDACEADEYGYDIGGVTVSDFVYPSWFGGVSASQYDHQKAIGKPLEILSGGYIGMWTPHGGWTQVTGRTAHGAEHRSRAPIGSRRERRQVGRDRWSLSTRWK